LAGVIHRPHTVTGSCAVHAHDLESENSFMLSNGTPPIWYHIQLTTFIEKHVANFGLKVFCTFYTMRSMLIQHPCGVIAHCCNIVFCGQLTQHIQTTDE